VSRLLPVVVALIVSQFLVLSPAATRAASLRDTLARASETVGIQSGSAFDALANAIAITNANNIPVVSASAGFTYRYNPQLEVFERSAETLGPIFLERPETLGQNKFNVNLSWQYVEYNQFDGTSLRNLQGNGPIVLRNVDAAGNLLGFEADRLQYRLGLRNNIVGFSFTYGVLDNLDVNLLMPLITTSLDVGVTRQQVQTAGPDGIFSPDSGPPRNGFSDGHAVGPGDLLLRLKYQLPHFDWLRSAVGLQMRFPTGREDDFQGTGDFWITPAFYASTILWDRVEPFVNAAIDFDTQDSTQSQARYGAGFDVDVIPRLGLVFAFLGRSQLDDPSNLADTNFLYLTPAGVQPQPLLGIDLGRKDFFDFSFGIQAVVWRSVMLFANGVYALNDQGLRNDTVIPTVGVQGTF
jgi:hypothetical protein